MSQLSTQLLRSSELALAIISYNSELKGRKKEKNLYRLIFWKYKHRWICKHFDYVIQGVETRKCDDCPFSDGDTCVLVDNRCKIINQVLYQK